MFTSSMVKILGLYLVRGEGESGQAAFLHGRTLLTIFPIAVHPMEHARHAFRGIFMREQEFEFVF